MVAIGIINKLKSFILRPIINKNYFEDIIVRFKQALYCFYSCNLFIIPGDNNAHGRQHCSIGNRAVYFLVITVLPYGQYSNQYYTPNRKKYGRQEKVKQK